MALEIDIDPGEISHLNLTRGQKERALSVMALSAQEQETRAEDILNASRIKLTEFLGPNTNKMVVPFSGGSDSTIIAHLAAEAGYDVTLITALPGFSEHFKRPIDKALLISLKTEGTIHHAFLDISALVQNHVINSVFKDFQIAGFPPVCSGCKVIMELAIATIAKKIGANRIVYGYTAAQADQLWPEQSLTQQKAMQKLYEEFFPDIRIGSPLFEQFQVPSDPYLVLAYLGYSRDNQSTEMKCYGAGMNPITIDEINHRSFVEAKGREVMEDPSLQSLALVTKPQVNLNLRNDITEIKFMPAMQNASWK